MDNVLNNEVSVLGNYNNVPTTITSNNLAVDMIDGLVVSKSADKMVWADGTLTYTVTIDNQTTETYSAPVVTDNLDITKVSFVADSVYIDDVKATSEEYSYNDNGTLTVNLTDIAPSSQKKITFQVTKK